MFISLFSVLDLAQNFENQTQISHKSLKNLIDKNEKIAIAFMRF